MNDSQERLKIFNSYSKTLETFQPIEPEKVRMYVCGMTVYDFCHLGHARSLLAFDMVHRWLKCLGYEVQFVRNITDIDDKIIQKAGALGIGIGQLTTEMTRAMQEDCQALGLLPPSAEPRATEYIPDMLSLIDALYQHELAYQSPSGDIHFAVRQFKSYGKLSGKNLAELRAGERVGLDSNKRDPLDFVLWKSSKEADPNEARWSSSYGWGRPGWHIECSAMSHRLLGTPFDIHGGGADLQFPHHENEIAQTEGALGHRLAHYWMHNGFVNMGDEKMSKSLGNTLTIRDILEEYHGEVLRFFFARAHYRSNIQYTTHNLIQAKSSLRKLYQGLRPFPSFSTDFKLDWHNPYAKRFYQAMNQDFSTPDAIVVLFELLGLIHKQAEPYLAYLMKELANTIGLLQVNPEEFLTQGSGISESQIQKMIEERARARQMKNYLEADAIRQSLIELGIEISDTAKGTVWSTQ
ncbi:MAG: cysteine--tRNA ligase [Gammaproteobacteria bacterium]|nr:cysteine--tRNA ligase [Gammaproteobacteria bacterium]